MTKLALIKTNLAVSGASATSTVTLATKQPSGQRPPSGGRPAAADIMAQESEFKSGSVVKELQDTLRDEADRMEYV